MRIIAGQFKSRQLKASPPAGTRPTSDRLRETLFNILGESVRGCTFLDGCAGMGAIGIEAISRGAERVIFVEQSRKVCRLIRENLHNLGVQDGFRILEVDLKKSLDVCRRENIQFDIAFVDPPYELHHIYKDVLLQFSNRPLLDPGGVLILEHARQKVLPELTGTLKHVRTVMQGDSFLSFFRPEAV